MKIDKKKFKQKDLGKTEIDYKDLIKLGKRNFLNHLGFKSIISVKNTIKKYKKKTNEEVYKSLINEYNKKLKKEKKKKLKGNGMNEEIKEEEILQETKEEGILQETKDNLENALLIQKQKEELEKNREKKFRQKFLKLMKQRTRRTREEINAGVKSLEKSIRIEKDISPQKLNDYLEFIKAQPRGNSMYVLNIRFRNGNIRHLPLTNKNIQNTLYQIEGGIEDFRQVGSDENDDFNDNDLLAEKYGNITSIEVAKTQQLTNKNEGGFFKHLYNGKYNLGLDKYGIYQEVDDENYRDNCLIKALQLSNEFNSYELENMKIFLKSRYIPLCKLEELTKNFKFNITLYSIRKAKKCSNGLTNQIFKYPKKEKYEKNINLCLYENHYFLNEKTDYTIFYIKNIDELHEIEDGNYIFRSEMRNGVKRYKKDKKRCITSFQLIKTLLEDYEKYFTPLELNIELLDTRFSNEFKSQIDLHDPQENIDYRPVKYKAKETKIENNNIFVLDIESYTDEIKKHSIAYLVCVLGLYNNEKFSAMKVNCVKRILDQILKKRKGEDILIYAHNAKFDNTFLRPISDLKLIKRIELNGKLMEQHYYYKGSNIYFRDSYSLIPTGLKKFGPMFKLLIEKEFLPYSIYTDININKRYVKLEEILKCVEFKTEDDVKLFNENVKKWGCEKNDKIDILEYSKRYCFMDCEVLKEGLVKFREYIKQIDIGLNGDEAPLDILNYLTISSVADTLMLKSGCYEGAVELSGLTRLFCQKAVVGGRTMSRNNEKIKVENEIVALDANSLYPASMVEVPLGAPRLIKNFNINANFYIIRIRVKKLNVKRGFSLLSILNEDGVRNFNNDLENEIIYIAKNALLDAIEFQGLEYEFIDGYEWNNGFSYKIKEVVSELYKKRSKFKKEGNPIQSVIKLLLNSIYGKTLLNDRPTKEKIVSNKKFIKSFDTKEEVVYYLKEKVDNEKLEYYYVEENNGKYNIYRDDIQFNISKEFNNLISVEEFNGSAIMKINKKTTEHFNRVHIGINILDHSKRLMNKVICLAEDHGINVYYQDTDSLFIDENSVKKLNELYKNKYNEIMLGNELGQFSNDFEINGCNKVVSKRSIFIGKKKYLCELEGKNANNEIIKENKIRMNGVRTDAIKLKSNDYGGDIYGIYNELYDGKGLEFDNSVGGRVATFKYRNNKVFITNDFCGKTIRV